MAIDLAGVVGALACGGLAAVTDRALVGPLPGSFAVEGGGDG